MTFEGICNICSEPISIDLDENALEILGTEVDVDGRTYSWMRHTYGPQRMCSQIWSRVHQTGETNGSDTGTDQELIQETTTTNTEQEANT